MCFCVNRLVCVCILVGCMLKCGCCSKHAHNSTQLRNEVKPDPVLTDDLVFLKQIFLKYGINGTLTFEGLQHLLTNLGLERVFQHHIGHKEHKHSEEHDDDKATDPQPHADHKDPNTENMFESTTVSGVQTEFDDFFPNVTSEEHNDLHKGISDHKCVSATSLMYKLQKASGKTAINSIDFMYLCPAIIYDLDHGNCQKSKDTHPHHFETETTLDYKVWLFASVAVLAISLCGLCSVALVPLVQRVFYQTVLQFLVGLAVGSLSGDSLLHLLPHAMAGLNHHDHQGTSSHGDGHGDHNNTESHMWRGLVDLSGIYTFYLAERLLTRASSCYRKKSKDSRSDSLKGSIRRSEKSSRSNQQIHKLDPEQSRTVGEKLSHHKQGSYGYKFDEQEMEDLQKLNDVPRDDGCIKTELVAISDTEMNNQAPLFESTEIEMESEEFKNKNAACASTKLSEESAANETLVMKNANDHGVVVAVQGSHSNQQHHHHHHHHHHSHYVPSSVSTVAWMVIMGDGLHNFCDGLAIGAAFASGISSGLSTTIAVFCHELPHELGDFAMLLKAGMSVKQALQYNALSSILCFFGMLVGVLLGNVGSATLWVFAGAAGMFLYIALVDMLPELTDQDEQGGYTMSTLFLQMLGIVMGIGIMLIIAIYEHDLRHLIS